MKTTRQNANTTAKLNRTSEYQAFRQSLKTYHHAEKTTPHHRAAHKRWLDLPACLRPVALEPPKFYYTETPFELAPQGINPDIPDNQAFAVMGINDRTNTNLDACAMHDRTFREFCVQTPGGVNLFLEPKHGASIHYVRGTDGTLTRTVRGRFTRPQTFQDPAWIARKLRCEYTDAHELKTALEKLNISDWQHASRIINGLTGTGKIHTPFGSNPTKLRGVRLAGAKGLTSYAPAVGPPNIPGLKRAVGLLVKLAQEAEAVTVEWPPMIGLDLQDDTPDANADPFFWNVELTPEEVPFLDDDLDPIGGDGNPYTAHALCGDGSDSLPLVYWRALKTANDFQLTRAAQKMRPYLMKHRPAVYRLRDDICLLDLDTAHAVNQIVAGQRNLKKRDPLKRFITTIKEAVWRRPNCGLTDDQTAHFWGLWHDRRAEIAQAVQSSPEVKRYAANLAGIKARNRAAAYLYALKNGTEWKTGRDIIHPAGLKVIPTALKTLWAQFNAQFPKAA